LQESQTTEWKERWKDEYLAWICGFANSTGGIIVLGRSDAGEAVGVINAKKLMTDLPNKIRDALGIIVEIKLVQEGGKDLIEIIVPSYPVPISCNGSYYVRSGATNQRLSGSALESYILSKRGVNWDSLPIPGFKMEDINDKAVDHFKKLAAKKGRIPAEYLDEPNDVLFSRMGLIKNGYLTNAAMLLFSENPQRWQQGAYVKIGFFRNHADLEYQDEIHGPLINQIDRVMEVVHLKYMKARITYEGIQRIERYFVPDEALREAILNAICHKDYSSKIPIQISVYSDQLYIGNVGRLPEHWTLDDLLGKHNSIPFNPDVANVFYLAGHIESWGRGIEKIFNACKVENVPMPQFKVHPGDIMIHFTAPYGFSELGVKYDIGSKQNDQDSDQVSDQGIKVKDILAFCTVERTLESIMKWFGMSHRTYFRRTYINPLLEEGLLRMTIPDKPTSKNQQYITTQKGRELSEK